MADQLVYRIEHVLKEQGDKLSDADKQPPGVAVDR